MECDPNVDSNQLECEEMTKDGYFISRPNDILYEYNNLTIEISLGMKNGILCQPLNSCIVGEVKNYRTNEDDFIHLYLVVKR